MTLPATPAALISGTDVTTFTSEQGRERSNFRLLTLPLELRMIIYAHLFASTHLDLNKANLHIEPLLAQISEIRSEVLQAYYSRVTCKLSKRPKERNLTLEDNLGRIGASNLRHVQHFTLRYGRSFEAEIDLSHRPAELPHFPNDSREASQRRGVRHLVRGWPVGEGLPSEADLKYFVSVLSRGLDRTLEGRKAVHLDENDIVMLVEGVDEAVCTVC